MMPMFGTNSANKKLPMWPTIADALTHKIDGDVYNLNWVDWNNDRHQDGWLAYMNLGVDSWRKHLEGRIADMIERYGSTRTSSTSSADTSTARTATCTRARSGS